MKIICIYDEINDSLAEKVGLPDGEPRLYKLITPGKKYTVLGLIYAPALLCYAGCPAVEIKNDSDGLSIVPLFMFDVIDSSASKYWHIKFKDGVLTMLPKAFYSDFFHDDLSEGIPEIIETFKTVCRQIEKE